MPPTPAAKRNLGGVLVIRLAAHLVCGHVQFVPPPSAEHGSEVCCAHVGLEREAPPAVCGQVEVAEGLAGGLAGGGSENDDGRVRLRASASHQRLAGIAATV